MGMHIYNLTTSCQLEFHDFDIPTPSDPKGLIEPQIGISFTPTGRYGFSIYLTISEFLEAVQVMNGTEHDPPMPSLEKRFDVYHEKNVLILSNKEHTSAFAVSISKGTLNKAMAPFCEMYLLYEQSLVDRNVVDLETVSFMGELRPHA